MKINKTNGYDINKKYYLAVGVFMLISIAYILIVNTQPFSDFSYYHELAKQIALGGVWGNTYTSVGYSIFLAAFYKLFGAKIIVAKLVNLALSILSIILFKKILNFAPIREKNKFIIFIIFVFFPSTIFYNSILCSEVLFTFLLLLSSYLLFNEEIRFKYVYIGILVGINTMVKPFFIVYFFAIFLFKLIFKEGIINALKYSLLVLLIALITLSPWVYRNTKYNKKFTFVSNNGGIVLYINNNSQNKWGRWMPIKDINNSIANTSEYKNADMTTKNKLLESAAKTWIKAHPKEFIVLGLKRLGNTYFIGDDLAYSLNGVNLSEKNKYTLYYVYGTIRGIFVFSSIIYILLYSVYILFCIVKRELDKLNKITVYFCMLFYMLSCVYFVTEGQSRYSFPIIFVFSYSFYNFINLIKFRINQKKCKRSK
ncbi:hypothetical protein ACER0A_007035 [Haloimpatiens sp. FM7315]|uniref:hypothetical protein n=1 Tax=Haloimpatiens sp. FM7315 TaxID=3298609 RepID=UPI00370C9641